MPVSHAKTSPIADFTSGLATVADQNGNTVTVQATNLVRPSDWNSTNHVVQLTGSEVASLFSYTNGLTSSTNAAGITVGIDVADYLEPIPLNASITANSIVAPAMGSWLIQPFVAYNGMGSGRLNFLVTYNSANFSHGVVGSAASTGAVTKTAAIRYMFGLYSRPNNSNSSLISTCWTGECGVSATQYITYSSTATSDVRATNNITYGFISQIDNSGNYTTTTVSTGGSGVVAASTAASTAFDSLITAAVAAGYHTGSVMMMVPFNTTLMPGNYWLAMAMTTQSSSTTVGANYGAGTCFNATPGVQMFILAANTAFKRMGFATSANSSTNIIPYGGYFASTSTAPPSQIAQTDFRGSTHRLYFNYRMMPAGTGL